jgi:hypothetical protein
VHHVKSECTVEGGRVTEVTGRQVRNGALSQTLSVQKKRRMYSALSWKPSRS